PDFESTEEGFYIVGVTPGSPAEAGGLMGGDRIIRLGEYEITDLYSYSYALGEYEPGDTIDIVVLRDGLEVTVTVTFASREERE
ncbi:PDZ domain-containing protein, partial [bacterium]|nr:PDZ domain-containing protein [bacterium]